MAFRMRFVSAIFIFGRRTLAFGMLNRRNAFGATWARQMLFLIKVSQIGDIHYNFACSCYSYAQHNIQSNRCEHWTQLSTFLRWKKSRLTLMNIWKKRGNSSEMFGKLKRIWWAHERQHYSFITHTRRLESPRHNFVSMLLHQTFNEQITFETL